jgi:acetyl-CoA synthetase
MPAATARRKLSFEALSRRSNQVANFLRAQGLKRGDHLLLLLGNVVPLWETMLAAMKLGVVVIPATTLLTPDELRDRLDRGRPRWWWRRRTRSRNLQASAATSWSASSSARRKHEGWLPFEQAHGASELSRRTARPGRRPDAALFHLRHHGKPKLVRHSQRSYPVGGLSTMYWLGCSPATCISTFPRRAGPSTAWSCFFRAVECGPAAIFIVNQPRFEAKGCWSPSAAAASPRCARRRRCGGCSSRRSLPTSRCRCAKVCGAGEPLNPEVIDQVRAGLGASPSATATARPKRRRLPAIRRARRSRSGSMGRPLPGYRVEITDHDGNVTKEGEVTLLLGAEPSRRPDAGLSGRRRKLSGADGEVYRSGDVVFADDEGYLTFVGRSDDVFKSSDYRISPFELESVLLEHESVAEAAVVPSPDPIRLAIPKAYVLLVSGVERSPETALSIFNHLHTRLAPFKRIRRIELVTELPKTISGKIRRVQLRRLEHDDNRSDALRGTEFAKNSFRNCRGCGPPDRRLEMNEVWKKSPVSFEAYQQMVGREVGVSSWHVVDQKRIDIYADVIEDHQFIHIDPERAKRETPFGTTVAHGFLTMSLLSIMSYEVMPVIEGTTMGVNYGFDKLRFISPVRSGSRVRGRFTLAEAKLRKPTELLSRTNVTVEIEGEEKPALVADWIGLIYFA